MGLPAIPVTTMSCFIIIRRRLSPFQTRFMISAAPCSTRKKNVSRVATESFASVRVSFHRVVAACTAERVVTWRVG